LRCSPDICLNALDVALALMQIRAGDLVRTADGCIGSGDLARAELTAASTLRSERIVIASVLLSTP